MSQRPGPRIVKFSATISHSAISLSKQPPGEVILKLNIYLEGSSEPITFSRPHSCLKRDQTGYTSSFYLTQLSTGLGPPRADMTCQSGYWPLTVKIEGGNENLITLYPGKSVEAEIAIADFKPTSKLATTHICGVSLGQLTAGERHILNWRPQGVQVWWWTTGTRESVIWRFLGMWNWVRGIKSFQVHNSQDRSILGLAFKAEGLPEIIIEE